MIPKHYTWQAMLFSFLVPAYEAATNWGRVGDTKRKQLWLWGSILGMTALVIALSACPTPVLRVADCSVIS